MSSFIFSSKQYFIAFLVVGVFGAFLFCGLSELLVRVFVIPKSNYESYKAKLLSNDTSYVAFGDSHGANALISNIYFTNFSFAGDNLSSISKKALFVSKRSDLIGVILPADPHFFANYRLLKAQNDLVDDLFSEKKAAFQFLRAPFRQYLLSYWKSLSDLVIKSPTTNSRAQGTNSINYQSINQVKKSALIRAQLHRPTTEPSETEHGQFYFETINELLRDGLQVCLVAFPVSSFYREIMSQFDGVEETDKIFYGLAAKQNVKYLNAKKLMPNKFFSDVDHLNNKGADIANKKILRECFGF